MGTSISRRLNVILTATTKAYESAMSGAMKPVNALKTGIASLSDSIVKSKYTMAKNTPGIANEAAKSGEQIANQTYSGWLKQTNKLYGKRSAMGQTFRLLAGGGVIGGFAMAANEVEKFTSTLVGLRNGTKSVGDALASIPLFGAGWKIGTDLRELITAEGAMAEEAKKFADLSKAAEESVRKIRDYSQEISAENAKRSQGFLGDVIETWGGDQTKTWWKYREQRRKDKEETDKKGVDELKAFQKAQLPKGQALKDRLNKSIDNGDLPSTIAENRAKLKEWLDQYSTGIDVIVAKTNQGKRNIDLFTGLGEANENMHKAVEGWGNIIDGFVDGFKNKYQEFTDEAEKENEKLAKEQEKLAKEQEKTAEEKARKVADAAKSIYEQTRTPLEKFQEKVTELHDLLMSPGGLDPDTYKRAVKEAMGELTKASKVEMKRPDLMLAGSAAAQRLAYENSSGYAALSGDKQLEAQRKANDFLKRIEGNTRQQPQLVTI